MTDTMLYFDNAATTFPKPECVYRAMDEAGRHYAVNAGRGSYRLAQQALNVIAETKRLILDTAKAEERAEACLTSSATIASNQIIGGIAWNPKMCVYVSPYEHNSILRVLYKMQKLHHFTVEELPLLPGTLEMDLEKTEYLFSRKSPDVVMMSHVSNVTGYILPVCQMAKLAKEYNALVLVDAAQAFGLLPIELQKTDIDFYLFAGHKTLYGPFGSGGFIQQTDYPLQIYLSGGTGSDSLNPETNSMEPGSPNIVAIAGLKAALEVLSPETLLEKEQELTCHLVQKLQNIPKVRVYAQPDCKKQVGIVAFNIEGYEANDIGMILDEDYNIAVRTGYQCTPLIHKYLDTVETYHGVVRAGLSQFTTEEDLEQLVGAVREIAEG